MSDRRTFLKASVLLGTLLTSSAKAQPTQAKRQHVSIIDLDRCDGCSEHTVPLCVRACRDKNQSQFPTPQKPIEPYWPQTKFEDFSDKKDWTHRLTPYNWLFVQSTTIEGKTVFLPRRCMHCFDAPCRKLCPFGVIDKSEEGMLKINANGCFGGAKCRDVCPWGIPQRQAGVGIYLDVAPKLAGGGVMYKCDGCTDLLAKGQTPSCAAACPKGAMFFGPIDEMKRKLDTLRLNRYVYGLDENGGTATWYISSIPFEKIHLALQKDAQGKPKQGEPKLPRTQSLFKESAALAGLTLATPLLAAGVALAIRHRKKKNAMSPKQGERS